MTETVGAQPGGDTTPTRGARGLRIGRVYTTEGVHPYDEARWERRDVVLTNWRDGSVNFEQRGVEFPDFWSANAANIVTTKYFRGAVGTPQRESSLRQLIDRVVRSYRSAGERHGYFAGDADAEVFEHELTWMLLHQVFAFNSPVWFNVGTSAPQQVSACQPYHALVSTPAGLVPIGRLVEDDAVGAKVHDAHGVTSVVATTANGAKEVLRLHTATGQELDVTADHLVWRATGDGMGSFVPAGELRPGDALEWHRRSAHGEAEISSVEVAEAALVGWLQPGGVDRHQVADQSVTLEATTVTAVELAWLTAALDTALPSVHRHTRSVTTKDATLDCRRTWLYGAGLDDLVARWGLQAGGVDTEVPARLYEAPLPVVAAYLRSLFQAEGYVSSRDKSAFVGLDAVSERFVGGLQSLLLRCGIFARVDRKADAHANRRGLWGIRIQDAGDRQIFADEIGFVDPEKAAVLDASLETPGTPAGPVKRLEIDRIERLGPMEVYDIQTDSGEYLSGGLRLHNCFILSVDDTMDSILNWYREEGLIFKGGSGAGLNLSRIRSSKELLSSGGTASGPVSFMRGADASAGTIKSGGATRRAAKMVVLDVDHPDVEEFIETKAREEEKIRVLRDAGFDMDLGGRDIASVQYQNANNSVRVSDEFMRAVDEGRDFGLRTRLTGEVIQTVDAKALFRRMAQAAWECADPGIQYDDTINDWHTNPETGRITASNPCFPADQRVLTDRGLVRIGDLVARAATGESFAIYTNDVTAAESPADRLVATMPQRYMVTGTNEILELRFSDGSRLRCTPRHRLWTENRGWVHADELGPTDRVVRSVRHAPRPLAGEALPASAIAAAHGAQGATLAMVPEKWDSDLAHYLGWLVGGGCLTDQAAVTVYGGPWEQTELLARHDALLTRITGRPRTPSAQANGTRQVRAGQSRLRALLGGLGVSAGRSADKVVPEAVFEAPEDAVRAFLRGLFDADGCVVNQVEKGTRYVGLGSRSEELLLGVQELLASLGVAGRIYASGPKAPVFSYTRRDGTQTTYGSDGPSYDLRISGRHMAAFRSVVGFDHPEKAARLDATLNAHSFYRVDETVRLLSREARGYETTYNLTEPRNHSYVVNGVVVANCSEYMSLDNSSCNLASLNLMKFLRDDGTFDAERFAKAVEFVITAMDISICFADFPTEKITEVTRAYRQLGVGYANLGALLMATGHAYDSEGGRALAAAITSLMTGAAYRRSAELAGVVSAYDGYARNASAHQRVMRKHAAANDAVRPVGADDGRILRAATREWQECLRIGAENGWRNAQASLLAPTGTIGFMMDCDTTGIEPDFSLVKFKKLVGGGSMQVVNQTVPRALLSLGYQQEQVEAIVEYISEHGHVVGAPGLRDEHYEVFDCAVGKRSIAPRGHVRMMAATQPFLSGAISKTVNMPESTTVEDVERIYFEGWKLGLKALAIYRDNCKVGQPLSDARDRKSTADAPVTVEYRPTRKRLPKKRPSQTVSFSVGGAEGYVTSSSYPDDGLGELFVKMSKQGSTLAGVMDAFSIAISIALQYGVPLETYVSKFVNMRFDPAGMTDDPDVRLASSVMDYLFRRLALDYLPYEKRADLGIYTAEERAASVAASYGGESPTSSEEDVEAEVEAMRSSAPVEKPRTGGTPPAANPSTVEHAAKPAPSTVGSSAELLELQQGTSADAPLCFTCGTKMRPAGSCYVCEGCGSTSGCS